MPTTTVDRQTEVEIGAQVIEQMSDAVNWGSSDKLAAAMLEKIQRTQRTLQQGVISAMKTFIEKYAEQDPNLVCDPRNDDAFAWAREVKKISDSPSRTLPGRLPFL